jgi:hypothetical protein
MVGYQQAPMTPPRSQVGGWTDSIQTQLQNTERVAPAAAGGAVVGFLVAKSVAGVLVGGVVGVAALLAYDHFTQPTWHNPIAPMPGG